LSYRHVDNLAHPEKDEYGLNRAAHSTHPERGIFLLVAFAFATSWYCFGCI
jgi:hypothetical protein